MGKFDYVITYLITIGVIGFFLYSIGSCIDRALSHYYPEKTIINSLEEDKNKYYKIREDSYIKEYPQPKKSSLEGLLDK